MSLKFDINVEAMSRDKLIANYFDAVHICEELANTGNDKVQKLREIFKITESHAIVLSLLLTGRRCHKTQLHIALGNQEYTYQKIIDVYISRLRYVFYETGIAIETIWGVGYKMDSASIQKANAYLDGSAIYKPALRNAAKSRRWTEADKTYLLENYQALGGKIIADKLGKSVPTIRNKFHILTKQQNKAKK